MTDIDSQPRITRNLSTPESREFWDSAEEVSKEVESWPDSKRAGINVSDRRTLCAVCGREAPGGISFTRGTQLYELCDQHSGMNNLDMTMMIRMREDNERLSAAIEETEHAMHMRIRAEYDKTVADCWRDKAAAPNQKRQPEVVDYDHIIREAGPNRRITKAAGENSIRIRRAYPEGTVGGHDRG